MNDIKVYAIANSIVSPLGIGGEENYKALLQGVSAIKKHAPTPHFSEYFSAALFADNELEHLWTEYGLQKMGSLQKWAPTLFEKMAILSIHQALDKAQITVTQKETIFIIATTKGNIEYLDPALRQNIAEERIHLWNSAQQITSFFGNPCSPFVISNACISGVVALIIGKRLLQQGKYKQAVICGADKISPFILNGFHSLKALSSESCRPYDQAHCGLNLGEGAATIVLSVEKFAAKKSDKNETTIELLQGATANDANHISGPSRTGEGLHRALMKVLKAIPTEKLAFVNAHGTATPFNDDMEAIAMERSGIQHIPVCSLKGYFGHALGAAGVIESAILLHTLHNGILPATLGFTQCNASNSIMAYSENKNIVGNYAIKCASGFGGCNAALGFVKK